MIMLVVAAAALVMMMIVITTTTTTPVSEQVFTVMHGGSHRYKPPSDENTEFVLHNWMFAENEEREEWERCLSYKLWFHIDCTERDGGSSFEMLLNSLILCKT